MSNWDYVIQAFEPPNKGGRLLLETVHNGTTSRDIEIVVYRDRMSRGEVSHIIVIDLVPPFEKRVIVA